MPQKLWLIVAVAAMLAVAASSANAASIYRGCDAPQWGTYPCWDSANPADVAAMHACPSFTDRHTELFTADTGYYNGFVKIRSTVSCKAADKLIVEATGISGWYPLDGWYWWEGFGHVGGSWHRGRKLLIRGLHIARSNWPTTSRHWDVATTLLEHDLITYDNETLIDCSTVPNGIYVPRCVNIRPASYARVRL
jgi:hypothetical protein